MKKLSINDVTQFLTIFDPSRHFYIFKTKSLKASLSYGHEFLNAKEQTKKNEMWRIHVHKWRHDQMERGQGSRYDTF